MLKKKQALRRKLSPEEEGNPGRGKRSLKEQGRERSGNVTFPQQHCVPSFRDTVLSGAHPISLAVPAQGPLARREACLVQRMMWREDSRRGES